jgi:hypothetical protein
MSPCVFVRRFLVGAAVASPTRSLPSVSGQHDFAIAETSPLHAINAGKDEAKAQACEYALFSPIDSKNG